MRTMTIDNTPVKAEAPDPEIEAILDVMDEQDVPPIPALTPRAARDQFEAMNEFTESESVHHTQDIEIEGPDEPITIRLYKPTPADDLPVFVFLHGGGFVLGGLDSHDNVCAALANRTEALVLSVDYRLAPEHPFPAAVKDSYAALEWAERYASDLGGDPERLAVGGDSAGGNLTASLTLLANDRDGPEIDRQLLIYPAVGTTPVGSRPASYEENAEGYFLEADEMEWFQRSYVQDSIHARNEYAAPLLARDLSGLPPASVITAGFDPLRDEGIEYARRLAEDGVEVTHRNYETMIHGFLSMTGVVSKADDCLDELADDLADTFEQ
ncbi:alpha/beta hydrolase [Halocatena salina]|uniref:Alpha/beta hydrolase n=1 Tax=Halocatena salina TaxID=2934340 RepID=A0A8U0A5Y7_9EURY|nr:alpha/beta hydrolase [Halocatena salina]UPM44269.1 alpha/beta hydrolase [Halocatena salina]